MVTKAEKAEENCQVDEKETYKVTGSDKVCAY